MFGIPAKKSRDRLDNGLLIEVPRWHFGNLNLDLMYALPGQTLRGALQDVETALGPLAPGDAVAIRVEGIGELENRVELERSTA